MSLFSTNVSSTCFGPHQSIFRSVFYKLYVQTLVCGNTRTTRHIQPLRSNDWMCLHIQLVKNAPEDGLVRSETCRANMSAEQTHSLKQHCVSCWTAYITSALSWFYNKTSEKAFVLLAVIPKFRRLEVRDFTDSHSLLQDIHSCSHYLININSFYELNHGIVTRREKNVFSETSYVMYEYNTAKQLPMSSLCFGFSVV